MRWLRERLPIDPEKIRELTSEPVSLEQGQPALPHVNRSVIIPDDARMAARVLSANYREIQARYVGGGR